MKTLSKIAFIGALTLPVTAQAQWVEASYGQRTDGNGSITRLEGGTKILGIPMNYGFADLAKDKDGNTSFLGQAQFTRALGSGAIKPTIGAEYQGSTFLPNVIRAQVGLDAGWKSGFAGLRVAPRIDRVVGTDNDLQVSLNALHRSGRFTSSLWADANLNCGQKPFVIGEIEGKYALGVNKDNPVFGAVIVRYDTYDGASVRIAGKIGF